MIKKAAEELGCNTVSKGRLSSYTTFGIGGAFQLLIEANGAETLSKLIPIMKSENIPFYVLGRGSNLLAADSDLDMVFIHIGKDMADIDVCGEKITCGAGASLSAVCTAARDHSLTGLEFAYGIPASVGGAVFMNAGAYGGEIKDIIVSAEAVDMNGNIITFTPAQMEMSYRHSVFSKGGYIITKAVFELKNGNADEITETMNTITAKRREKQPLEYKSAGSTFKRPKGAFAAALIEQCGLKGYTVGGAQVSMKHSGFVINTGKASFEDVMAVVEHVKKTVFEQTGFELECEPEIIR